LSSHIDVISTCALVTYNWSSFGHDAKPALARYFDAFIGHCVWGIQRLRFRFPKHRLKTAHIEPYLWEHRFELEPVDDHLILKLALYDEDRYGCTDHDTFLSPLAPLRDDILCGNFRLLYWRGCEPQNRPALTPQRNFRLVLCYNR
jgi:hypothetical protein